MLVGGWGAGALALLEAGDGPGATLERSGASLGVAGVEGADEGRRRRWRAGRAAGAFVLVEHDRERDVALVARDYLGGRPLVYAHVGAGLLFAEHEHQILDLLPAAPGPDRLALEHWVERGASPQGAPCSRASRGCRPATPWRSRARVSRSSATGRLAMRER